MTQTFKKELGRVGTIINDAIIVTSTVMMYDRPDEEQPIYLAWKEAQGMNLICTSLQMHKINGESTFMIVPDGSKEGWPDSDRFDNYREQWKVAVSGMKVDWYHVRYGEVEQEAGAYVADSRAVPRSLIQLEEQLDRELGHIANRLADVRRQIKAGTNG